jgi:bla regulator protein blaR1
MIEVFLIAKVTILLALALVAVRMARTARASVRHMLLAATFAMLAVLPIASVAMPPVAIDIPISVVESAELLSSSTNSVVAPARTSGVTEATRARDDVAAPVSLAAVLRAGWALGAVMFVVPVVIALMRIRRLRLSGLPWLEIRPLAQRLATDAGLARSVDVLLHDHLPVPMTVGWVRPAIMLPVDAREWTEAERRNALVHELEHVRRADWVFQLIGRVACALYWFHPLAWIAWREMALDAERACDDAVLQGTDGPAYATQLVSLASRHARGIANPALGMANRSDLAARVSSILKNEQSRGRASRWAGATVAAVAILVALTVSPLRAVIPKRPALLARQTPNLAVAGAKPAFEVASIKRHHPDDPASRFEALPGGKVNLLNQTLEELIGSSYGLQKYQVIGGPDWVRADAYDVLAKAQGEPPLPERLGMVRQLLADRFKLVMHQETRELPIFRLVKARGDGQLGPAVKASTCTPMRAGVDPKAPTTCYRFINQAKGILHETRNTFRSLATSLGRIGLIGRPVVDQTGLTDQYAFELMWTPDQVPGSTAAADPISIFTALQEQLGLKLESATGPVEVYVIDSVERPTEN